MTTADVAVGDARNLRVTIRVEEVRRVLEQAPKVGYFWLRDYLFRSFQQHRVKWLQSKGTRFGRGGAGSNAIHVPQVNASMGPLAPNQVRYRVQPVARRMPTPAAAAAGLNELVGAAETGNLILPVHEFGRDIRSNRDMYIPVRTRPGNFGEWRRRYPNKTLLFLPSKKGGGNRLVYELQTKRGRGRPAKNDPRARTTQRLKLRFVITRHVDMKPTLRLYDSWDGMRIDRDRLWSQAATKMERDLQRKNPRDF